MGLGISDTAFVWYTNGLEFMSLNQFAKRVKLMLIMPCPYYYGLVIQPLFDTPKVLSFMSLNRFVKQVKIMPCPCYYGLVLRPLFGLEFKPHREASE